MPKDDNDTLFGNAAVAKFLRVSRMTLNRWVKVYPLPVHSDVWNTYCLRYSKAEIREWRNAFDEALAKQKHTRRYRDYLHRNL